MTPFTFKFLVQKVREKTTMTAHDVRHRVTKYGLGKKVGERVKLYTDSDVKKIVDDWL